MGDCPWSITPRGQFIFELPQTPSMSIILTKIYPFYKWFKELTFDLKTRVK
jgi:hypothetical protein